jgi:hypothetical protein
MSEAKLCESCNNKLIQRPNENTCNFKIRKYCNQKCYRVFARTRGHWVESGWITKREDNKAIA